MQRLKTTETEVGVKKQGAMGFFTLVGWVCGTSKECGLRLFDAGFGRVVLRRIGLGW
jgi:hypothetical protein